MAIMTHDNGGDFEPIPLGMHRAICANVFDVGIQPGYQGGPNQSKVVILWEIEKKSEKTGKRFTVTKIYTNSIGEKSNLGNDLTSWRTRAFTEEERKGFDLEKIIGAPCQLNIVPGGQDGTKAKVAIVLPKDSAPYWDIETGQDYMPNFVKKMVEGQLVQAAKKSDIGTAEFDDDIPFN